MNNRILPTLTSLIALIFIILSPSRDLIANLTILVGTFLVLTISIVFVISKDKNPDNPDKERMLGYLQSIAAIIAVFGMFFGSITTAFIWLFPFSYYLLLSIFITLQLMFSIKHLMVVGLK